MYLHVDMYSHPSAPTFISSAQSIREDGGSLSICILGGITNETVAIQTQNTSNAESKLVSSSCFISRIETIMFAILLSPSLGPSFTICMKIWVQG